MTLQELMQAAADALNQKWTPGFEKSKPHVIIKMRSSKHESKTRRLVPGGHCPTGEVIAREIEFDVVAFDAVDLLAWCVAQSRRPDMAAADTKEV